MASDEGKRQLEKELVRHAYDNVIERCARLAAFSGTSQLDINSEDILTRQIALAIDDVISLSISARRLVSVCGINLKSERWKVKKCKFHFENDEVFETRLDDHLELGRLFGVLIHCEKLEIIDSDLGVLVSLGSQSYQDLINWHAGRDFKVKKFSPKILVRSDRSQYMLFDVADFIQCIDEFLLPKVIDITSKHGLYLEDEYRL